MGRGISLHIGLNRIDSTHYGSDGVLGGCENDARAMQLIASSLGYETTTLLTPSATADAILAGIQAAANRLAAGDTFLLTFAGHGAQIPDESGDENDLRDETLCAYDVRNHRKQRRSRRGGPRTNGWTPGPGDRESRW